ncbi:MAG: putative sulfate/molybdate transporter [Desulfobacteraceae bacterium]|nr:putative sulfate/molybdate transporter [Desulfobacteraceae bacterium]
MSPPSQPRIVFNRMELAGSLGDLGTLLPIAVGMILVCGIHPTGLFCSVGLFYVLSGLYYGVTTPVQPMKVIGAYAIATAMTAPQVLAAGLSLGMLLLIVGATGLIDGIRRVTPKATVRGVQLSTGALLMAEGVRFMLGTSKLQALRQAAEPYLTLQQIGPVPLGVIIGAAGFFLTLMLLENRKLPAGVMVVAAGLVLGLIFGTREGLAEMRPGLYLPRWMPFSVPEAADFAAVFFAVVLPQLPMTLGNAVIANADLSREYFGEGSRRVTPRALCITMALANFGAFLLGGMPLCHGAGGLAAHYRFGARTAGSNLIIGGAFLALALLLGFHVLAIIYLMPLSVLGILLVFAGAQLALTILDLDRRKDLFVALLMLGITLATNLAAGFLVGIAVALLLRSERLHV